MMAYPLTNNPSGIREEFAYGKSSQTKLGKHCAEHEGATGVRLTKRRVAAEIVGRVRKMISKRHSIARALQHNSLRKKSRDVSYAAN